MLMRPIAVAGIVAGVIGAAGAGAYLAVRQNAAAPQLVTAEPNGSGNETAAAEPAPATEAIVEATDAVVEKPEPTTSEEPRTPVPAREARRSEPVTALPSPPTPPRPEQTAQLTAPEPQPAAPEPTTAAVAEPAPTDLAPVPAVRAGLPTIEGWTRPGDTAPPPETAPAPEALATAATDIGVIDKTEPDPPVSSFVELEITADSVIGLQVDTAVSTRSAEVEDTVDARVTRDVLVENQVAVRAGTRMLGSVVLVETGGKLRDAARLGVRFHTLVMDGGLRVPIVTETIYREGRSRGSDSVAKIGGAAVGGAILGAIFGGSRGAAIGGSIGAAGGTAAALNGEPEPARLPPGTRLTVRLSHPVAVTVEQ